MRKIALLLSLALLPWFAHKLGGPKWVLLTAATPFFLLAMSMNSKEDDPEQNMFGEASEAIGKWALLLLGIGAFVFGIAAFSLKGTSSLIGIFWWVLPATLIAVLIALIGILRK